MTAQPFQTVDALGLKCPLPRIKADLAFRTIASGEGIRLLTDDPEAPLDIAAWCTDQGHELVEQDERDGTWEFSIKKG